MKLFLKIVFIILNIMVILSCSKKEVAKPIIDLAPISNFEIDNHHDGTVTIRDSSLNGVIYELDYGDGSPLNRDSLNPGRFRDAISGHVYLRADTNRLFKISFKVFNKSGKSDIKIKKVTIPALPIIPPTLDDSLPVGYINTPGEIKGIIDNVPVHFTSNDSTSFSGSMLFNNFGTHYIYSMLFSNGVSRCQINESFIMLLPIYPHQNLIFENNPPEIRYNTIRDSLKTGKSFSFAYTLRPGGNGIEEIYLSKTNARLIEVKEVDISPDFYLSVYKKGLDVTFQLKSDEFKSSEGKAIEKKMDILIKMRLVFDRKKIQPFVNVTSIGFCF